MKIFLFNLCTFVELTVYITHFHGLEQWFESIDHVIRALTTDRKKLERLRGDPVHRITRSTINEIKRVEQMLRYLKKRMILYMSEDLSMLVEEELMKVAATLDDEIQGRICAAKYWVDVEGISTESSETVIPDEEVPVVLQKMLSPSKEDEEKDYEPSSEKADDIPIDEFRGLHEYVNAKDEADDAIIQKIYDDVVRTRDMSELIKHLQVQYIEDNKDSKEKQQAREEIMNKMVYLT